ncbi:uncharacterized protein LOC130957006 [Arachis stenosperma]|uniref:uncharacterized protein LOC130957006 n=1 Tax=Arachis stenosperma TaxID=217475 RepID=UPI0025AD57CF|nr:uncharacterized protein LOC130957006 [Arachis stenosperma]
MSVREAMERSLNGSKIILRLNEKLQVVGDGDGLLSGILEALGSDYNKFPICEKIWTKMQGKDRVYDDCIKEMFHFQEDSGGRIKKTFLQQMGRSWKDTRGRLYNSYYKLTRTLEQNLEKRPEGIPREHWRWFIDYHNDPATKEKISEIEQLDKSTRILSENDSLAQALGKEHSGRVRGIGFGPIPSQFFRPSLQPLVDRVQVEEAKRMLCELQVEVTNEKVKRKAMKDELAAAKTKRQTIESVLSYLAQQQGGELPPENTARMNSLDGYGEK